MIEDINGIVDIYLNKKTDIEESENDDSQTSPDMDVPTATECLKYIKRIRNRFMVSLGNVPDELEEIQDRRIPGYTGNVQPNDQGVIRLFKSKFRN